MLAVTIIMPVYNAQSSVGRTVDSILAQTFTDWELIAIDDGSTDGSGYILDNYAVKDSRIKVIHKSNGGVASARQVGINNACGTYTIHADSDDWIEPNMLHDMVDMAERDHSDIVIADFFIDNGNKSIVSTQKPNELKAKSVLKGLYDNKLFGGLWHKLIRRSIYDDNRIHFIEGVNYCEDLLILTKMLLWCSPKISYLPKAYYHYFCNDTSLTRQVNPKGLLSLKRFHQEATKVLTGVDGFENVCNDFALNEFIVLFTNKLYESKSHLHKQFKSIKPLISKERYGFRWRLGFHCIEFGLTKLAHQLIKF